MITQTYKERVAADLFARISSIKLNGQEVEIVSKVREKASVTVLTKRIDEEKKVEHVAIYDELGEVITERYSAVDVSNNRSLDFRFTFEVTD
ncbi:hypothetical protein [Shouchella clausii]|uniref:hypothetical protein n=1 Tax=Shouchella clausii TaxID=79880 RepID=UPI001C736821|nr:hypothetical protein [Shouchella clausii]MBX0319742.1 hypothetical protein [Shouchella clausii]